MAVELYDHQKTALALLRMHDGFALFMEQGTGKTFPVLFRLAELASKRRIRSAVIAAPKAVCPSWSEKMAMLSDDQREALGSIDLHVVSYDTLRRRDAYKHGTFDALVCDESHYVKTPSAQRTKVCMKMASRAKYRYLLTGTPTSNGQLCNLWSQMAIADPMVYCGRNRQEYVRPACFGGLSYRDWLDRVAYLNKYGKPYRYRNIDEIQEVLGELSYRITKEECLTLPEKLPDEILHCEMPKDAKGDYKAMARHSAVPRLDMLAENPLTRLLRLRQMCSGYVVTDAGETVAYDQTKLRVLAEFVDGFEGKFVVFCHFRKSIDQVAEMLESKHVRVVTLDGRSNGDEWAAFQNDPGIRAIVCQYQSGSAGIDLYAADTCIFYEPTDRSDLLEQARDRIHRVGQTRPCSYYHLLVSGSVEFAMYRALRNYQDFGEALFSEYLTTYTKGGKL